MGQHLTWYHGTAIKHFSEPFKNSETWSPGETRTCKKPFCRVATQSDLSKSYPQNRLWNSENLEFETQMIKINFKYTTWTSKRTLHREIKNFCHIHKTHLVELIQLVLERRLYLKTLWSLWVPKTRFAESLSFSHSEIPSLDPELQKSASRQGIRTGYFEMRIPSICKHLAHGGPEFAPWTPSKVFS